LKSTSPEFLEKVRRIAARVHVGTPRRVGDYVDERLKAGYRLVHGSHIYRMMRERQYWLVQAAGYAVLAMSAVVVVWIILAAAN
jgi:uncharacterized membrane-anchored protein